MSLSNELQMRRLRNQQQRESQAWSDRVRNDITNPANRYRNHLEDFRDKKKLDEENQRAMALENRKQLGQFDIAKLQEAGQTARTKMTETGLNRRSEIGRASCRERV